jgi:hypothetical protein
MKKLMGLKNESSGGELEKLINVLYTLVPILERKLYLCTAESTNIGLNML